MQFTPQKTPLTPTYITNQQNICINIGKPYIYSKRCNTMKIAIIGTDNKLCRKIAGILRNDSFFFKISSNTQLFNTTECFVNQLSMNKYFFDLVIICPGENDLIIESMKNLMEQGYSFILFCVGKSEKQLYDLLQNSYRGFVFEKDIDEYFIPMLKSIISEEKQLSDIKIPFDIAEPTNSKANIPISDIIFFVVEDRTIHIHTLLGSYRLKRISLEKLQDRLKPYGFAKVNRSHLINMSHIKAVQGKTLELDNGYTTEMSRSIHKQIKRAIMTQNINT